MKDLLKDAIADAKAVRETALANAKLALEEAFTPRIQSMLSAKLSEELEDDEMYEGEEEEVDVEVAPEPTEEVPAAPAPEAAPEEEMTEEEEATSSEELEEAYNVIRFLKGKINEVNLLNAKLLYSNKLFRNFVLAEGQKMKVIENFDRAHNLREVKLVFSTLAEGFKSPSIKKSIKESYASKPVASTKPAKRILSEGADLANRFQKLAGLKK
jgi:hypothetical protein